MKGTSTNNTKKVLTRDDLIDTYAVRAKENREQEARLKQGKFNCKSYIIIIITNNNLIFLFKISQTRIHFYEKRSR